MKKFFFFKSSSGNGTGSNVVPQTRNDNRDKCENASEKKVRNRGSDQGGHYFSSPKGFFSESKKEVFGGRALRRTRSFSSAAFLVDGNGEISSNDPDKSPCSTPNIQPLQLKHSSRMRDRCLTPERRSRERQFEPEYNIYEGKFLHDSSGSSSSCSSNVSSKVLDRFIDGEEHMEGSKQMSNSPYSNISGSSKNRRLPPRGQCMASISDSIKDKGKSHSFREAEGTRLHFSSCDREENGFGHESPRVLARSVIEKLSQTNKSKVLNHAPITLQEIYSGSNEDHRHGGSSHVRAEADIELKRRYEEAEKRAKMLSVELEEQRYLSHLSFDVSSLVESIRALEKERVSLAFEVLSVLRTQMAERDSSREEIRHAKTEIDMHIQRLEKEKHELQTGLEKEIDRRSSDWSCKIERYQLEEARLRERVRELAEQNVSLKREVSTFHEKETENTDMIACLEGKVKELTTKSEEVHEENLYLRQNLSRLQESYERTTEDLDRLRRNFEEKDKECQDLHKSVTRIFRTCREQEKTIEELRDGLSGQLTKQPSEKYDEMIKKLQMEQIRLTGIELSLRKEVELKKVEADSLHCENKCLLERLKGNGDETSVSMLKLENELKMRVCCLQDQGLSMLNESAQLCFKLLKFIKGKSAQSINNGLAEQFMVESEMKVQGIRRGAESLKSSLQAVSSLLHEKSESSYSGAGKHREENDKSFEVTLRGKIRVETLLCSLLREKLYSKEQELEGIEGELAAAVRGNEILRSEVQTALDNLSVSTHELENLKLQMLKKEENISQLKSSLEVTSKELVGANVLLPKVSGERDEMWRELKQCSERNLCLNSENETLKRKIEGLDEELLLKEGQISILKDALGTKQFDLLSTHEFSEDFLVE